MGRALGRPKDPDALGRLFAALRVRARQRPPDGELERAIDAALQEQVTPEAARRLLRNLDATPRRARSQLLGEIADPGFVPPRPDRRPERAAVPTTVTIPTPVLLDLGRGLVDTGAVAEGAVEESMSDGESTAAPVYTIVYRGLWCEDETTWDWASFADEVYVITSAVHIEGIPNEVVTVSHPVAQGDTWYDDVDSDEARLGPLATCWRGNSEAVSITAVLMEHDEGDPDAYRTEVDLLVRAAIAVLGKVYPPLILLEFFSSTIADAVNWLIDTGDDPLGTQTVVLPRGLLEQLSTSYRATFLGRGGRATGLEYHFLTTHSGGGSEYTVGFEILREPERLPEGPFL